MPIEVSGSGDTPVSAVLGGLAPNTTYYYRVVATNAAGTTNGAEQSFRTATQVLDFTIYTLGDLTIGSGSIKGRIAAGGTMSLSSMSIGNGLSGTSDVVIANGDLTVNGGSVLNGDVVYGGTATLNNLSIPQGTARQVTNPLSPSTETWVKNVATAWKNMAPNGSVSGLGADTLTLSGTDATRNVFLVSGADLARARDIQISAPVGSTVVINVSGASGALSNTGMSVSGTNSQYVVFNFFEATTLAVGSVGVQGMIWAPAAAITIGSGSIDAKLVGKSLQASSVSFNGSPYLGLLP